MAAMLTLTDVAPYNLGLGQILAITLPACVVGILVTALVVNRMWKDIDDDAGIRAKISSGQLQSPKVTTGEASAAAQLTYTRQGRNSAIAFLLGVLAIVAFGIFPDLRPSFEVEGEMIAVDMTTTIVVIMFVVGSLILYIGRPKVGEVPGQSVFKAGMISAIALFGIAWLTATFIAAHEEYIIETIGGWVTDWKFIFALAVFLVAALTTSQSTATRTIVPIGPRPDYPRGL